MSRLPHSRKQLFFVLLSLADLTLTWVLIQDSLGSVYESNPVAAWWLDKLGWAGLALFKAIMVLLTIGLCLTISRWRPRTGGRLLTLGCTITAGVVLYSSYLYVNTASAAGPNEVQHAQMQTQWFAKENLRVTGFLRLQESLANDLAEGRRSLSEVVKELETAAQTQGRAWVQGFRQATPASSDRERFALRLISLCLAKDRGQRKATPALAERLKSEYRSLFGALPPNDR